MEDRVTITVDGRVLEVPKATLLWEACQDHGIDIPIFCYHTKLGPVGACRTCLVEVEGQTKGPITACSTPVADGMVVRTKSPVVAKAQRGIFEFLLLNHPLDCPICDRAGECPLQDQTFAFGPGSSRYIEPKRHHVKPVALGPTIALDRERCVLCWRCVRFCAEVAEDKSIVLLDRGDHTIVGTFQDEPYVSNFSGNVTELCPVGALTSRKQRFNFRPWELANRPSVCPHCPMGCNINISVRKSDEVIRFLSRDNPDVDDSWLCDRGRYNFEFINSPERLKSPLIRRNGSYEEVSWNEALEFAASRLQAVIDEHGAESVAGMASPQLTNEDLHVFKRFMNDVIGSPHVDHFPRPQLALSSIQQTAMARLQESMGSISDLQRAKTIVLLEADPSQREPVLELRIRQAVNKHGAKLVIVGSGDTALTSKATLAVQVAPEDLAAYLVQLRQAVTASVPAAESSGNQNLANLAQLLINGPVVLLYDDAFEGIEDKGGMLESVAALVEAVGRLTTLGTLPLLDAANSQGARDLGVFPADGWNGSTAAQLVRPASGIRAALFLGVDLAREFAALDAAQALSELRFVMVSDLFLTDTARIADVVLPASSFAEKMGTFTSSERRIQALTAAVPSPGIARPEWEALVDLSQYFDAPLNFAGPQHVWDDIRDTTGAYRSISWVDLGSQGIRPGSLQPV